MIDLRGDTERQRDAVPAHAGFAGDVLFAPGETAGTELAPHEEAGRGIATAAEARAAMTRLYANMPFRPVLVRSLRLVFRGAGDARRREPAPLPRGQGSHRARGRAASTALLGVHADDVMADYLLTNTAGDPQRRIASAA